MRAVIAGVTRRGTSRSGNPTYDVHLEDGRTFATLSDGALNYAIGNEDVRGVPVQLQFAGDRVASVWDTTGTRRLA